MPARKRATNNELSRLTVLAAGDEAPFAAHVSELLASGDRLSREAALAGLVERPLPGARDALRQLYWHLDEDGLKRDQGSPMREAITRILATIADSRDRDIALRAAETREAILGHDMTWRLRARGLMMLAAVALDLFPYVAIEHLDDAAGEEGEPANTAFQLLARTGHYIAIYQWLISGERATAFVTVAFELLSQAPGEILERYTTQALDLASRRGDEPLAIVLCEAIVQRELRHAYPAIGRLMATRISAELYNFLSVLLAATNRPQLLSILEDELHHGRHARMVADALRIRTTAEQAAILTRWEDDD